MKQPSVASAIDAVGIFATLDAFAQFAGELHATALVQILSAASNRPVRGVDKLADFLDTALVDQAIHARDIETGVACIALIGHDPDPSARRQALLRIAESGAPKPIIHRANEELARCVIPDVAGPGVEDSTFRANPTAGSSHPHLRCEGSEYELHDDRVVRIAGEGSDAFFRVVLQFIPSIEPGLWRAVRQETIAALRVIFSQSHSPNASEDHFRGSLLMCAHLARTKHLAPAEAVTSFVATLAPFLGHDAVEAIFPEGDVPFPGRFEWTDHRVDYGFISDGKHFLYHDDDDPAQRFLLEAPTRSALITSALARDRRSVPPVIDEAIVFPTAHCSLGCAHCRFSSMPVADGAPAKRLNLAQARQFIALIERFGSIQKISIGGGGEPTDERAILEYLLAHAPVREISIMTGATWGSSPEGVDRFLRWLDGAARVREAAATVELNVSVDRAHLTRILPLNPGFLDGLVSNFDSLRRAGSLSNVHLHLRTLSPDGRIPPQDPIREAVTGQGWTVRPLRRDRYALDRGGCTVLVSFNAFDRRHGRPAARRLLQAMRVGTDPGEIHKLFVSYDGAVSLGRYYPVVPLGTLDTPDVREHVARSPWFHLLVHMGVRDVLDGAAEVRDLEAMAEGCGLPAEILALIAGDPSLILYLLLRYARRTASDAPAARVLVDLGLDAATPAELAAFSAASDAATAWSAERRRNWGLRRQTPQRPPVRFLTLPAPERDRLLSFANPWWDARNADEREAMLRRVRRLVDVDVLLAWVQEEVGARYGQSLEVRSLTVCGSFAYSLTTVIPPADLDIEVLVANPGVRAAAHDLVDFDFSRILDADGPHPRSINVWVISEEYLHPSTTNVIDIDVAYNATRGLPLLGPPFQAAPVPMIERVKMATFYACLVLTVAHDGNFGRLVRRRMELQAILVQAVRFATADLDQLYRSPNIAAIDLQMIEPLRYALTRALGTNVPSLVAELVWLQDLADREAENAGFDVEAASWRIVADSSRWKRVLLGLIGTLDRIFAEVVAEQPLKGDRRWVYDIMLATNRRADPLHQMRLAQRADLDYSTAVALASRGAASPAVLRTLINLLPGRLALSENQRRVVRRAAASNPLIPADLARQIYAEGEPTVLASLLGNPSLPRDLLHLLAERADLKPFFAARAVREERWDRVLAESARDRLAALLWWLQRLSGRTTPRPDFGVNIGAGTLDRACDAVVDGGLERCLWVNAAVRAAGLASACSRLAFGDLGPGTAPRFLRRHLSELVREGFLLVLAAFDISVESLSADDIGGGTTLVGECLRTRSVLSDALLISGWGILSLRWRHSNCLPPETSSLLADAGFTSALTTLRWYWRLRQAGSTASEELEVRRFQDAWSAARAGTTAVVGASTRAAERRFLDETLFVGGRIGPLGRALQRVGHAAEDALVRSVARVTSIEFHSAGDCNLSCRFCLFGEKRRANRDKRLGTERVHQILAELALISPADRGRVEVKFGGIFSDPLESAGYAATLLGLREARALGFRVGLTTNGLGIDPLVIEALASPSTADGFVNLSLDAGTPEVWRLLKRRGISPAQAYAEFDKVIANLGQVARIPGRHLQRLGVHVSMVMQNENLVESELRAAVRLCEDAGVDSIRFRFPSRKPNLAPGLEMVGRAYDILDAIERERLRVLIVRLHPEDDEGARRRTQIKPYLRCRVPLLRAVVGPSGNFHPCEHRAYEGGGVVATGSLRELASGTTVRQFTAGFIPAHEPRCAWCPEYDHNLNCVLEILDGMLQKDPKVFSLVRREFADLVPESARAGRQRAIGALPAVLGEPDPTGELAAGNEALSRWFRDGAAAEAVDASSPGIILSVGTERVNSLVDLWHILLSSPGAIECLQRRSGTPPPAGRCECLVTVTRSLLAPVQSSAGYAARAGFGASVLRNVLRRTIADPANSVAEEREATHEILDWLRARSNEVDLRQVTQAALCLDIFRDRLAAHVHGNSLDPKANPIRAYVLLRDGEPLLERLKYPDSPLTGAPVPLFLGRDDLLTAAESLRWTESTSVFAGEYERTLFARSGRIYAWLEEILGQHAATARAIVIEWVTVRSEVASEISIGEIGGWMGNLAKLVWLAQITRALVDKMAVDAEIRVTLHLLLHRAVPELLADTYGDVIFLDSGFKGSLVVLLSALIVIWDFESVGKDPRHALDVLLGDSTAMEGWRPRARPFVYGTTDTFRDVLPNAGFDRWGHGGVNEFLEQLPKQHVRHTHSQVTRDPFSSYQEFYRSLTEVHLAAYSIPRAADVEALVAHVLGLVHDAARGTNGKRSQCSGVVIFLDLDDVVFRPIVDVGSECWFRNVFSTIPPWESQRRKEAFERALVVEAAILAANAWTILLDPRELRERLRHRLPDGCNLSIVAFSARNELQQGDMTRRALVQLGLAEAFDELRFSPSRGLRKVDRLVNERSQLPARTLAIMVDDAMHNLLPLVMEGSGVAPIQFVPPQRDGAGAAGLGSLLAGLEASERGNLSLAALYFLDAEAALARWPEAAARHPWADLRRRLSKATHGMRRDIQITG